MIVKQSKFFLMISHILDFSDFRSQKKKRISVCLSTCECVSIITQKPNDIER